MSAPLPFWQVKSLDEMSDEEWESLCDGCGRCCLNKVEDEDTGHLYWTTVACNLLDARACRCSNYAERHRYVPDCVKLTPDKVRTLDWLPSSCAYVRVHEGRDLAWWHHLVSGDRETVHLAGISVRDRVTAFERDVTVEDDYGDHLIDWNLFDWVERGSPEAG